MKIREIEGGLGNEPCCAGRMSIRAVCTKHVTDVYETSHRKVGKVRTLWSDFCVFVDKYPPLYF